MDAQTTRNAGIPVLFPQNDSLLIYVVLPTGVSLLLITWPGAAIRGTIVHVGTDVDNADARRHKSVKKTTGSKL